MFKNCTFMVMFLFSYSHCVKIISSYVERNIESTVPIRITSSFSFCIRFNWHGPYRTSVIFDAGDNRNLQLILRPDINQGFVYINNRGLIFGIPRNAIKIFSWQNLCVSISKAFLQVFVEGDKWYKRSYSLSSFNISASIIRFGIDIGRKNLTPYSGYISQLNIWSKDFSESELGNLSKDCSSIFHQEPDVINWNLLKDSDFSANLQDLQLEETCLEPMEPVNAVIPMFMNFENAFETCKLLGSEMRPIDSENIASNILEKSY